jgi:tetratricopeptide (TPR) repeat protein
MGTTFSVSEEAQLAQTIEMFEVITQSQPHDYQSLEILKEAYAKLGREADAINTSKRIAQAYVELGQLSSAILEYETILQRHPEDPDVQKALKQIESTASSFPAEATAGLPAPAAKTASQPEAAAKSSKIPSRDVDDGRRTLHRLFVESKIISSSQFDLCWPAPDLSVSPADVTEPFIKNLADKDIYAVEKSLKLMSDKSRVAYLPLTSYDMDIELARSFPPAICRRWCILPFDRMSQSIFVATANPFNQQAARELAEGSNSRLLWYLVPPADLVKTIRKIYR